MTLRTKEPNRCKHCKVRMPAEKAHHVIHTDCIDPWIASEKDKKQRKAEKEKRAAAVVERKADAIKKKRRGDWIREAQAAFNLFIRTRDQLAGHSCISSGKPLDWTGNAVDAGHYRSRGSAPHLRFDERNCYAQSKHDNRYESGNVVGYRAGLIARIGLEAVEALESDQTPRKHSIDDLKAIKAEYTAKTKTLKDKL